MSPSCNSLFVLCTFFGTYVEINVPDHAYEVLGWAQYIGRLDQPQPSSVWGDQLIYRHYTIFWILVWQISRSCGESELSIADTGFRR